MVLNMIFLFSNVFSNAEAAGLICHKPMALINAAHATVEKNPSPSNELKGIVQVTKGL